MSAWVKLASGSCRLAAALGLIVLASCNRLPGKPQPKDRPVRPDKIEDFKTLFAMNCSGCHGAQGYLGPAPPLNDKLFLKIVSPLDLESVICVGRDETLMPGFINTHPGGHLTDDQVKVLVDGLKKEWGGDPGVSAPIPEYSLPRESGSVAAGKKAYSRACSMCHGREGQGGDAGAINRPAFLALISDQALRRLVITGRHDLGMPSFAQATGRPEGFEPLTNQEVNDIVALLASWKKTGSETFK